MEEEIKEIDRTIEEEQLVGLRLNLELGACKRDKKQSAEWLHEEES